MAHLCRSSFTIGDNPVILPFFFFFKQKTAYEMRISDWSSDVCSSDLQLRGVPPAAGGPGHRALHLALEALALQQHASLQERLLPLPRQDPLPQLRAAGHLPRQPAAARGADPDRKSTRLNSSH